MKNTITLLFLILSFSTYATQAPIAYPQDTRIKQVSYSENNVIPIHGEVFTTTQLVFGKDEYVLDVEGGDREGWVVTYHKVLPNMLFLKPTIQGTQSNMTVVTNKHTYYFNVKSSKHFNETRDKTYAIKFIYPIDERRQLNERLRRKKQLKRSILSSSKHPKQYNWDYAFHGDRSIMPAHVFDDGVFTYFELRPKQTLPAVFSIDNKKGEEALVNFSRKGNYLVIHRVSTQFTLRAGKHHVASIFNNKAIRLARRRS